MQENMVARAVRKGFGRRFFNGFNAGFTATTNRYKRSIQFLIRRKWIAILALLLIGLALRSG